MHLFRKRGPDGKPSGNWHAWWYDSAGQRHQRCTRTTDKRTAEAIGVEWERTTADPVRAASEKATLHDALDLMLQQGEELAERGKRSPDTLRAHRTRAGHFIHHFGRDFRLAKLRPSNVDDYVSARRDDGATEHTIHKELCVLRLALRAALRREIWHGNVEQVIPRVETGYKPRERWLPMDEVHALLGELLPDRAACVAFMLATSAEWGATRRAERSDIAEDRSSVLVRGTKNPNRWRRVPIVTDEQRQLLAYALDHAGGIKGKLFRAWSTGSYIRDLRRACTAAKIAPATPNDFRRTLATWLRAAGVPAEFIALMLGHVDSRMVERVYGRLDVAQLGAVVRAAITVSTSSADGRELGAQDGHHGRLPRSESSGNKGDAARDAEFESATFGFGGRTSSRRKAAEVRELVDLPSPKKPRASAHGQQGEHDASEGRVHRVAFRIDEVRNPCTLLVAQRN